MGCIAFVLIRHGSVQRSTIFSYLLHTSDDDDHPGLQVLRGLYYAGTG